MHNSLGKALNIINPRNCCTAYQRMSLSTATKCPFLTRVPKPFIQHSGPSMSMYAQKCPVMSRLFHVGARSVNNPGGKTPSLGEWNRQLYS